jgi:hypothetical protein
MLRPPAWTYGEIPMDGKWGKIGSLAVLLGLLAGCRNLPPNVKPEESAEVLNPPPLESRYNASSMPKEAFYRDDPSKRYRELGESAIMPTKAGGNFGGPAGMGGFR